MLHSLKPALRPERFGYAALLGEAVEPGAAMGLKEAGVPWNVPMLNEGGRVFTAWEATCCKAARKGRKERGAHCEPSLNRGEALPAGLTSARFAACRAKCPSPPPRAELSVASAHLCLQEHEEQPAAIRRRETVLRRFNQRRYHTLPLPSLLPPGFPQCKRQKGAHWSQRLQRSAGPKGGARGSAAMQPSGRWLRSSASRSDPKASSRSTQQRSALS